MHGLALLVIDMQRGLFEPPDARYDRDGTVRRINRLAEAVREAKGLVVFIQHEGAKGDLFEPNTPGWEFLSELEPRESDLVVAKRACDSFYQTGLSNLLRSHGIEELWRTGRTSTPSRSSNTTTGCGPVSSCRTAK